MPRFHDLLFTPTVQGLQARMGSRASYARLAGGPRRDRLGPDERAFLAARDSCYLASVGEGGWPYVQHRGGPPGFLRVLDDATVAVADFRGNRQYISVGNLAHDDRVAMILVDYPNQARLKLLARAAVVEAADDPDLLARLAVPGYPATIERALRLTIEGFDWNCPQHITPRFTLAEVEQATAPLRARVAELERQVAGAVGDHAAAER
ncbi:MAG: pyridoxamine 5'-phosphate oxidase family protein [Kofleriaceae bacterium]